MNSFSSIERETATETAHNDFGNNEQLEFKDSSNCYEESKGE